MGDDPFTPPNCDLRGMPYMPLFGDRLFGSATWIAASAEAKVAALRLWWRSFAHEVPAASLPDDDALLADYAGYGIGVKAWRKVKAQAMRGWVKCSDGRLYHKTVAEAALDAWKQRLAYKKDHARLKKWRADRGLTEKQWAQLRARIFERDGRQCTRCSSDKDLHCDHVLSLAAGGTNDPSNLTTLCVACHAAKTTAHDMPSRQKNRHVVTHFIPPGEMTVNAVEGKGSEGKGREVSNSVPNGTGGKPPDDPVKLMFDAGVELLTSTGCKEPNARSLIGKWRKDVGDDAVMAAITEARRLSVTEPISWFTQRFAGSGKPRESWDQRRIREAREAIRQ